MYPSKVHTSKTLEILMFVFLMSVLGFGVFYIIVEMKEVAFKAKVSKLVISLENDNKVVTSLNGYRTILDLSHVANMSEVFEVFIEPANVTQVLSASNPIEMDLQVKITKDPFDLVIQVNPTSMMFQDGTSENLELDYPSPSNSDDMFNPEVQNSAASFEAFDFNKMLEIFGLKIDANNNSSTHLVQKRDVGDLPEPSTNKLVGKKIRIPGSFIPFAPVNLASLDDAQLKVLVRQFKAKGPQTPTFVGNSDPIPADASNNPLN